MSGVPIRGAGALPRSAADKPEELIDGIRAPDRELVPGVEVETDVGTWQVIETPGHAPSHVCLHQPERRLLLSGDHLLGRTVLFFDYGHTPDPLGEYLDEPRPDRAARRRPLPARPRQTVPRTGSEDRRGPPRIRRAARQGPRPASPSAPSRPPSRSSKRSSAATTCGAADRRLRPADHPLLPRPPGGARRDHPRPRLRPAALACSKRLRSALSLLVHPRRLWREHRRVAIGADRRAGPRRRRGDRRLRGAEAPGDVHNEKAIDNFKPEKPKAPPKPVHGEPKTVNWPMYGLNPQRTRYLPARGIKPPFANCLALHRAAAARVPADLRRRHALRGQQHRLRLRPRRRKPGRCSGNGGSAASTPPRRPTTKAASTSSTWSPATSSSWTPRPGKIIWKHVLPGRAESSPLVVGNSVYFGCEDG